MLAALAAALELTPLSLDAPIVWTWSAPDSVDKLSRSCWAYRFCYFPPPKDEPVQVPANPVDYFRGRMIREEGMPPKAPDPVVPNDDGGAREFLLTHLKQKPQHHVLLIHNRRTGRIDFCERMLVRDPQLVAADQAKQREERRKARALAAQQVDRMDIHS